MMLDSRDLELSVHGRTLCSGLTFGVQRGEVWGVLGPNGSGKTTLLHVLAGVRRPDAGTVQWEGRALAVYPARERARRIALMPQHEQAEFWGTALEYVLLGRYPRSRSALVWDAADIERARTALEEADVSALAQREYATLSGGERQRVRIAQALAQEADCMLLDEPLAHIDLAYQGRVLALMKTVAGQGRAVVMVLHDALWAAQACSHVLLLDGRGGATSGRTDAALNAGALERLYGCRVREFVDGGARYMVPGI